ncbi:MAG TPA: DUF4402 domain-containing protein [Allosphingosinicella sp.]|nr:DUF4402 domain-containing protein [Allosphingosinicella sp.]
MAMAAVGVAPAQAQQASTSGSTAIVEQFSLTNESELAFGAVLPPTSGSNTIIIDAGSGARSLGGGGNAQLVGTGTSRATYTVEGDGGQSFDINVPANVTLTRSGGTETIVVTLTASGLTGELDGSPGNAGSATFGVGGSFPITTSTVVGFYQGNFVVTVDNN